MAKEERIEFRSDGLVLEGMLARGERPLSFLMLHPHPQYGGDMDNHIVTAACAAFSAAGATTMRFNFRGTGGSHGAYDGGKGEAADARAAAAYLREATGGHPLILAGYSFGALVAASAVLDITPVALALVSPPRGGAHGRLPANLPILAVTGTDDPIAPPQSLEALAASGARTVVVPGVDHGWWPGVETLQELLLSFARESAGA
jgi:alpha/beta superfamily hydrolase